MTAMTEHVPIALQRFVGLRPELANPHARAVQMAFTLITARPAHAHTPFGRMSLRCVLLNDETRSYLYDLLAAASSMRDRTTDGAAEKAAKRRSASCRRSLVRA